MADTQQSITMLIEKLKSQELLIQRIESQERVSGQLEHKILKLEERVQDIMYSQVEAAERIKNLYEAISEIRLTLREIAKKLEKPDLFKSTMFNFAIQLLQWGIIGGLLYYMMNK